MKPVKAMTLRLEPDQAEALETIARVDDLPIVEVVRAAISEHIDARRSDSDFRRNLRDQLERAEQLLDESKPEAKGRNGRKSRA